MSKRKRVCIDFNLVGALRHYGYLTGVGRTTLELVQTLAEIKDELPFDLVLYTQNLKGVKADFLNLPFENKHLYLRNKSSINKWISKLHLKEMLCQYDLFHIPHNFGYSANYNKTIVTLHDVLFMRMQESVFGHENMKKEVPSFAHKVKGIITCSEYSKKDMIETMNLDPEKIHVIPWGYNKTIFYQEQNREELKYKIKKRFEIVNPYFISVSCNAERKNTHVIIDNYIQLLSSGIEVKNDLCLVWSPPAKIKERVDKSPYANRIHFLKNISDDDLRLLYNGATASIFLSLYEGFGLTLLESMACGTPVISSSSTSLSEIGGDAVVYVDPKNNEQIQQAMLMFENQNVDKFFLIDKGLRQANKFSWEKCAKATASVYEQYLYQS
jgi:Glycosyltransferase